MKWNGGAARPRTDLKDPSRPGNHMEPHSHSASGRGPVHHHLRKAERAGQKQWTHTVEADGRHAWWFSRKWFSRLELCSIVNILQIFANTFVYLKE